MKKAEGHIDRNFVNINEDEDNWPNILSDKYYHALSQKFTQIKISFKIFF